MQWLYDISTTAHIQLVNVSPFGYHFTNARDDIESIYILGSYIEEKCSAENDLVRLIWDQTLSGDMLDQSM